MQSQEDVLNASVAVAHNAIQSGYWRHVLSIAILALTLVIVAIIIVAIVVNSRSKPRQKGLFISLGRAFDPRKPRTGLALFAVLFGLAGGNYLSNTSFAASCVNRYINQGMTNTCVGYAQDMLNDISYRFGGEVRYGHKLTTTQLVVDNIFGSATKAKNYNYQLFMINDNGSHGYIIGPDGGDGWLSMCNLIANDETFSPTRSIYRTNNHIVRAGVYGAEKAGCPFSYY